MAPIPVTIITGFLGSGKTTLILNLLPQLRAANPSYRLALLKNEFGDLAVDSQLASSSAVSGVQELLNGCICCNLVGQLSTALEELSAMDPTPDRIVIETSGSAFPATLAIEINRLARATGRYVLDGVVSVIDVENWKGYEDTSYTAKIQARYTDLIVFNKWEGCDERRFDEVLDRVGDLEVDVAWVKSSRGWVEAGVVFGVDGALAQELREEHMPQQKHEHNHTNGHAGDHHTQEVEVLSVTLKAPANGGATAVDAAKLQMLLKKAPKDEVYRVKAVMTAAGAVRDSHADADHEMSDKPARWILNWAFGRWTFTLMGGNGREHHSSDGAVLRMTIVLARYESGKWTKKLKENGWLELLGPEKGELGVVRIS